MAMKKVFFLFTGCWLLVTGPLAQTVSQKLQKAFQQFESDSQLRHAISSLYVIDAKTGNVVFERNAQVGLAPASTQKIITSVTAFELLGKEYRYKTFFSTYNSSLYIYGNCDPTLGSWRYPNTIDTVVFGDVINAFKKRGVKTFKDFVIQIHSNTPLRTIPAGWIYQDIGNYYGASPYYLNWKENQFDITFIPGSKVGDPTMIDTINTGTDYRYITNQVTTGREGSGDNAYVYFFPGESGILVEGTIPKGGKKFSISAAEWFPSSVFATDFVKFTKSKGIYTGEGGWSAFEPGKNHIRDYSKLEPQYTHYSPSLDSIIYWFNKKSINLYGEALVKTFAYEKTGFGSTDTGVAIVKKFWNQKGLDEEELNIYDGSGLSPLNRVTTHAQVEILKYAKTRDWFPSFYDALPEYNGMKMKSGTISDVKGFCGYHTAKDGKEYIFSFLVNNYSGRASQLVGKMYKVLEVLK
jgi:D-alanyl-D-alanine carboxypeptidase/D-alanyl-D-alanine-endopeptidase (penicillin-binding protein 4)